jgi:hypothetical protein
MSLFLLAMSFVHLGGAHANQIWSQELAFHHAAIPVALFVLLQDYRFVLLDAFLRFLANVLLAALFVFAAVEAWLFHLLPEADTPFHVALLLAGACLVLILFAVVRGGVQRLLTRLILRRGNEEALLRDLRTAVTTEEEYIASAATRLGSFMGAPASVVASEHVGQQGVEAIVPLRIASGGPAHILLGRRTGGRRYLSEDLQALARAAALIAEQVEQYRESEMRRLVAQAELRALQSQIHPHFLFNALNTLYGIIPRDARGARETVLNLADIFLLFPGDQEDPGSARRRDAHREGVPGRGAAASGGQAPSGNRHRTRCNECAYSDSVHSAAGRERGEARHCSPRGRRLDPHRRARRSLSCSPGIGAR